MAKSTHILYECGICGQLHPWDFKGDCRDDANRYSVDSYAEKHGISEHEIEARSWEDRQEADLPVDSAISITMVYADGREISFKSIDAVSDDGEVMVSLSWIGEGIEGDYNASNPEDEPRLRFDVYRKHHEGQEVPYCCDADAYEDGDWMAFKDASYCTRLVATAPRVHLTDAARFILAEVEVPARDNHSIKKLCERLSRVGLDENGKPVL